jgi:hypothetical protein
MLKRVQVPSTFLHGGSALNGSLFIIEDTGQSGLRVRSADFVKDLKLGDGIVIKNVYVKRFR